MNKTESSNDVTRSNNHSNNKVQCIFFMDREGERPRRVSYQDEQIDVTEIFGDGAASAAPTSTPHSQTIRHRLDKLREETSNMCARVAS